MEFCATCKERIEQDVDGHFLHSTPRVRNHSATPRINDPITEATDDPPDDPTEAVENAPFVSPLDDP